MINSFETVAYSNPNLFGIPVNVVSDENKTLAEELIPVSPLDTELPALTLDNMIDKQAISLDEKVDKVPLGEQTGLLPNLANVSCSQIGGVISDAETLATTWRPTPELLQQYEAWLQQAKTKQKKCAEAAVQPVPKKTLSKNLTPVVILLGALVAAVAVYKIVKR